MKYEVRYQIGGEEHTAEVDVDDAASAVQLVQERFQDRSEVFELIQVHLLEDFPSQEIEVEATH
jgi:hypothetical protein